MKKTGIFRQLLFQMIAIVYAFAICLKGIVVFIFVKSYESEIYGRSQDKSQLVSGETAAFLSGAYRVTEELSVNPSILTMKIENQTPILEDTAELTQKAAVYLEKQLYGIRDVADRIDHLLTVSEEMEQEMTKFKL